MKPPVLEVEQLSFSYGNRHVLTAWSAAFAPGLSWLRGANGCGKTTLLKLLAGALDPTGGRLAAAGIDAALDPLGYRRNVFWCGPGAPAFNHLRPAEFFSFMATLYPSMTEPALSEAAHGLGLQPWLHARITQLSSGNQRKVWLAAALAAGTPAVLLDEPFNALDVASANWLRQALSQHARADRQAWLIASHESPAADAPCRCVDLQPMGFADPP